MHTAGGTNSRHPYADREESDPLLSLHFSHNVPTQKGALEATTETKRTPYRTRNSLSALCSLVIASARVAARAVTLISSES